jgi:NAD-dependent dihydropyrimidine dehydrogenase PreA subunit
VDRSDMSVGFEESKCSLCELCITACPTRAMSVRPINKMFFE